MTTRKLFDICLDFHPQFSEDPSIPEDIQDAIERRQELAELAHSISISSRDNLKIVTEFPTCTFKLITFGVYSFDPISQSFDILSSDKKMVLLLLSNSDSIVLMVDFNPPKIAHLVERTIEFVEATQGKIGNFVEQFSLIFPAEFEKNEGSTYWEVSFPPTASSSESSSSSES